MAGNEFAVPRPVAYALTIFISIGIIGWALSGPRSHIAVIDESGDPMDLPHENVPMPTPGPSEPPLKGVPAPVRPPVQVPVPEVASGDTAEWDALQVRLQAVIQHNGEDLHKVVLAAHNKLPGAPKATISGVVWMSYGNSFSNLPLNWALAAHQVGLFPISFAALDAHIGPQLQALLPQVLPVQVSRPIGSTNKLVSIGSMKPPCIALYVLAGVHVVYLDADAMLLRSPALQVDSLFRFLPCPPEIGLFAAKRPPGCEEARFHHASQSDIVLPRSLGGDQPIQSAAGQPHQCGVPPCTGALVFAATVPSTELLLHWTNRTMRVELEQSNLHYMMEQFEFNAALSFVQQCPLHADLGPSVAPNGYLTWVTRYHQCNPPIPAAIVHPTFQYGGPTHKLQRLREMNGYPIDFVGNYTGAGAMPASPRPRWFSGKYLQYIPSVRFELAVASPHRQLAASSTGDVPATEGDGLFASLSEAAEKCSLADGDVRVPIFPDIPWWKAMTPPLDVKTVFSLFANRSRPTPPAVLPPQEIMKDTPALLAHMELVNWQLRELSIALFLASRLQRIVILPPFLCGLDKVWYPHTGVFTGAALRLPFVCPTDHFIVIRPKSQDPNHLDATPREFTFLKRAALRNITFTTSPIYDLSQAVDLDGAVSKARTFESEKDVLRVKGIAGLNMNAPDPFQAARDAFDLGTWCCLNKIGNVNFRLKAELT